MAVLRAHVERVEVVGLDEAYLDLTGFERPTGRRAADQGGREDATGLGCSIGIGPNKLVAKVASDAEKPDGFVVLSAEQARERFAGSPPGPDPRHRAQDRRAARAAGHRDSRRARRACRMPSSASGSARASGPGSGRLARFEDDRGIETVRVAKSESRETTFDRDLRGLGELEPHLRRLTEQLCETLERQDQRGRTIGIKVRYDDFSTVTRARSIAAAGQRAGRRLDGRGRPAAPPRPAPPGAPDRRARRGARRGCRGDRDPRSAEPFALASVR